MGTDPTAPEAPGVDQAEHHYLSTACRHRTHKECRDQCKFCPARCSCSCHPWFQPPAGAPGPDPRVEAARRLRLAAELADGKHPSYDLKVAAYWLDYGPSERRDAVARALLGQDE